MKSSFHLLVLSSICATCTGSIISFADASSGPRERKILDEFEEPQTSKYNIFKPQRQQQQQAQQQQVDSDILEEVISVSCPEAGAPSMDVPAGTIALSYGHDTLCTLTKLIISDTSTATNTNSNTNSNSTTSTKPTTSIPIAISYDNNPWEQSPGEFATLLFSREDVNILCNKNAPETETESETGSFINNNNNNTCQINLPPLDDGETYVLSTFNYSLSEIDEYARFLETATFGITLEELEAFEKFEKPLSFTSTSTPTSRVQDAIIHWISNQMNISTTPLTSHREIWRRGAIGRVSVFVFLFNLLCFFFLFDYTYSVSIVGLGHLSFTNSTTIYRHLSHLSITITY